MPRTKRNDLITITTRIKIEQKKSIDEIALKNDMTGAQLIRRFIERGIEEYQNQESNNLG